MQSLVQQTILFRLLHSSAQIFFQQLLKYPLPAFGQRIIGWGTGAEGARQRLENIQPADVSVIKTRNNA